jgi:hypothetical protein
MAHCRRDHWSDEDVTATVPLSVWTRGNIRAACVGSYPIISVGQMIPARPEMWPAGMTGPAGEVLVDLTLSGSSEEEEED